MAVFIFFVAYCDLLRLASPLLNPSFSLIFFKPYRQSGMSLMVDCNTASSFSFVFSRTGLSQLAACGLHCSLQAVNLQAPGSHPAAAPSITLAVVGARDSRLFWFPLFAPVLVGSAQEPEAWCSLKACGW